ncbi:MAG: GerMN domain-containing protein [bacterium]|nr:GerMN domain-containing protein [bacterium]
MKTFQIVSLIIIVFLLVALAAVTLMFLRSPEDSWICQDGEWVMQGSPSEPMPVSGCGDQAEEREIYVTSPQPGQTVTSPLTVEGRARGGWYFEASFPIELVSDAGERLGISFVQAQSDWMTPDFVPFLGELHYQAEATTTGKLILRKDNPSGLPKFDDSFEVPVVITPSQTIIVKAFFSNNNLDPEISCNKVFEVERRVPKTVAVARAALEQLLAGPTEQEAAQGFFTSVNPGVTIQELTIADGTAKVDFDEALERSVGGSCRVAAIHAQITETLKQFATVDNVIISVNGRTEDILQP